jgi:DNA-binding response OmpR family regulator
MNPKVAKRDAPIDRALLLVIEDDEDVAELLRLIAERAGFTVAVAPDGAEGLRQFFARRPALVLLDVDLPELDGWQVLDRIRELSDVPVMMLTASSGQPEKVRGLQHGADDYVTKPFGHQELLARIGALLRRSGTARDEHDVVGDARLQVDMRQRRVTIAEQELPLTPTEFKLLAVFARHPDRVLSQDQLLEMVWGEGAEGSRPQVKLYVGYLRRKLRDGGAGEPIETVRGFGYRYRPDAVAPG